MTENLFDASCELQRLLNHARQRIYVTRLLAAVSRGLRWGLRAAMLLAVVRLAMALVNYSDSQSFWNLMMWGMVAIAAIFASILASLIVVVGRKPSYAETAQRLDLALQSENRVASALEFSRYTKPSVLMNAAIEDGIARIRQFHKNKPELPTVVWNGSRNAALGVAAAALLLLSAWIHWPVSQSVPTLVKNAGATTNKSDEKNIVTHQTADLPRESKLPTEARATQSKSAQSREEETLKTLSSPGNVSSGSSDNSSGSSSQNASASAGAGMQGQASKSDSRKNSEKVTTNRKQTKVAAAKPEEKSEQGSLASASGRGGAGQMQSVSNAGKSASAPEQARSDELDGDLQEVDDNKNSQHRGSVQPMPQDRNASPSRELGLPGNKGLGGTGRGGPTPPKKSRGTGSLLLAAATPDFVPGQMRPGPSRVTHDEVPPQQAAAGAEESTTAKDRITDEQVQNRFDPAPELNEMLLNYFKALHSTENKSETVK